MHSCAGSDRDWRGALYALPVEGKWLVYSAESGSAALMNSAAVRRLAAGVGVGEMGLGDLVTANPRPERGDRAEYHPAFLGLIPTRNCNLGCPYCDFRSGAAGGDSMTFRVAAGAIRSFADDCVRRGTDVLDVHLFGGEPLMARDVVEVIVHRARLLAGQRNLSPHLEIATNGVYSRETAQFVADYFDMVVLSVDGAPEYHDRQRCRPDGSGSYDSVAASAEVLSGGHGGLILRVCVSQRNVGAMAETVRWFGDRFAPSAIDFEPLQPTAGAERAGLAPPEPLLFAAHYLEARDAGQEMGLEVTYSGSMLDGGHGYCPAQEDGLIVSPEGKVSSCYLAEASWRQRGLDLSVGGADADGLIQLAEDAVPKARTWAEPNYRCRRCFCLSSCRGGCLVHHSWSGGTAGYDDYCIQTRLITASMLLQQMGQGELAGRLTSGDASARDLVSHPSDRLTDWSPPK